MRNLLVPTDYSVNANNAYAFALGLASKFNADITAVHTFQLPLIDPRAPSRTAQAIIDNEKEEQLYQKNIEFKKMRETAAALGIIGQPVDLLLLEGDLVTNVCHAALETQAELVVMGTKGAGGIKEVFLGSNASQMLENATIPILAIPEHAKFKNIHKVAYFSNFDDSDIEVLARLLEIVTPFNVEVHLVHIVLSEKARTIATNNLRILADELRSLTELTICAQILLNTDLYDGMMSYVGLAEIDIISMLSHKRGFFEKLFNPSNTQKTIQHTEIPLLSFRK
ncbi:MAG: universal stress protein [Sphingobacteriales bacterium]|nr:MAG: universal stress protein [Sphingobacteriales bacterium]